MKQKQRRANPPRRIKRVIGFLRSLGRRRIEVQAGLQKKAFYCAALSGESNYNISVNSDMTVSCNCQDFDQTGRLGDLRKNTLREVFDGPVARDFRDKLAAGRLPISRCARCWDLRTVSRPEAAQHRDHYDLPRTGIMVENTILCNLQCFSCCNQVATKQRVGKIMSLEDVKKISREIKEHQIRRVSYFKLGEPFLSPRLNEELAILKGDNPDLVISVSTNGVLVDTDRKRDAALMLDEIIFSIDGIDDATVTQYQVGSDFGKAHKNLVDLVKYRNRLNRTKPLIEWKYVLFNWNDRPRMIYSAIEMARQSGVDLISFWPTLSPLRGISWRYYLGGFFKKIGQPSWKGREVLFNDQPSRPQTPKPAALTEPATSTSVL